MVLWELQWFWEFVYATVNLKKSLAIVRSKAELDAGEVRRAVRATGFELKELKY